jgi:hypothetical protein
MLSRQEQDRERRETLLNDQRVREQAERHRVFADQSLPNRASTYSQHAIADAATPRGRFTQVETSTVIGAKADVAGAYSAASAAHQTELPPELPTGYRIDALDNPPDPVEVSSSFTQQETDPTSAGAPSTPSPGSMFERSGVGSLSRKQAYRRA